MSIVSNPRRTLLKLAGAGVAVATTQAASAAPDPKEANRALVLRYFNEMWNHLDPKVAEQIVAPDVIGHVNGKTLQSLGALKTRIAMIRKMYATTKFTIDAVLLDGDHAVVRWTQKGKHTGAYLGPGTAGKQVVVTGMNMFRLAGGRITEIWVNADDLGEIEQLGLWKAPA